MDKKPVEPATAEQLEATITEQLQHAEDCTRELRIMHRVVARERFAAKELEHRVNGHMLAAKRVLGVLEVLDGERVYANRKLIERFEVTRTLRPLPEVAGVAAPSGAMGQAMSGDAPATSAEPPPAVELLGKLPGGDLAFRVHFPDGGVGRGLHLKPGQARDLLDALVRELHLEGAPLV